MTSAYVESQDRANPKQVLKLQPANPEALNAIADRLLTTRLQALQRNPSERPAATGVSELAMRSLRSRELNPVAIRLLAFDAMLEGDMARARTLAQVTLRLTRREPLIYLVGIQDAAQRNDYAAIIHNYDRTFTVAAVSRNVLVPSLVTALSDAAFRRAFAPYVKRNPGWMGAFLRYAALNTGDPASLADLLIRAGGMPPNEEAGETASVLAARLFEARQFTALRRFIPPAFVRAGVWRRTDFSDPLADGRYAPATWQLLSSGDVDAGWRGDGVARRLSLATSPGEIPHLVARKLVTLPPASYRLRYRFADIGAQDDSAQAYWSIGCLRDGAAQATPLWSGAPLSTVRDRPTAAQIAIPAGCAMQELTLTVVGGNDRQGLSLTADPLSFEKAKQ